MISGSFYLPGLICKTKCGQCLLYLQKENKGQRERRKVYALVLYILPLRTHVA